MMSSTRPKLDPGAELRQLLTSVRESLGADTAVMLLLDATGSVLEPFASSGLDVTLRTGARVPVGQGFAGSIVATGKPRVLEQVTEQNVVNPVLSRRGLQSLLGVPLLRDGTAFGVLHVGSLVPRTFDGSDVEQLEKLAADLSSWFMDQSLAEHHTAALVLQRSLIPTIPPAIDGLDVAGRYIPAEGDLGGDWYDVFPLPGGRVGFVMGDVLGHGLQPAVVMGRIRSALRSYALVEESPARVLQMLDKKISHFESGTLASVLFAVSHPPFESFTMSSAGHWPPLVAQTDGPTSSADVPTDAILGLVPDVVRTDTEVEIGPRGSLCLFTDGLIEQRFTPGGPVDPDAGLALVTRSFSARQTAESACIAIVSDLLPEQGSPDDVALLVVRRAADDL
ncbi:MAG: GAF domain-containing protein [Actinomycetales bacterium]|nr:MAG: GAF domain-containing protein [Actinomycetales bacterium]